MSSTEKRIEALEQASPDGDPVMFIHFVGMGETHKEIQSIASNPGAGNKRTWTREAGESEQHFKDRAEREAMPSPTGCKVFTCS